jgi:hypothetical protein
MRPSPAVVIALVALFASLAGGATAASLITGDDVADSSLTGADVRDGSLGARDLAPKAQAAATKRGRRGRRGPRGPRGLRGAAGANGLQGPAGPSGPTGGKGDKGDKGNEGVQGERGPSLLRVRDSLNFGTLEDDYAEETQMNLAAGSWLVTVKGQVTADASGASATCRIEAPGNIVEIVDTLEIILPANARGAMVLTEGFTQAAAGPVEVVCKDDATSSTMANVTMTAIQVGSIDEDAVF